MSPRFASSLGRVVFRALRLSLLAGVLALLAAGSARAAYPTNDPFYAAPADLASYAPGTVLRTRRVKLYNGIWGMPYRSFQVLYRTTDHTGAPTATVASIFVPPARTQPAAAADRRLVSYQTAYDGLSPGCRPSYSLRAGSEALQATETVALSLLLERGWTVVTSDYEGPYDEWGVAETSAYGVLDGIRAAESFEPAGLDGVQTKVGIMGYSGGGNATAWANERKASYAPELRIVGSVQGGVAPDLDHLVRTLDGTIYSGVALAGIAGITGAYPELGFAQHLNAAGRKAFATLRSRQGSCIGGFVLRFAGVRFSSLTTTPGVLDLPEIQAVASEQALGKSIPTTPTMWLHTTTDEMKSYGLARSMAKQYCAAAPQRFVSTDRVEHLMQFSWMPFLGSDWLAGRFAGTPARSDCAKL